MTDIVLAIAILVGVPCGLVLLGSLALEQIRLMQQEWSTSRRDKEKAQAEARRAARLMLLDGELQELEEEENRRF